MVFLGTSPFEAPSLYRLMSYLDFEQGVFFPQGGMHTVTEALVTLGTKLGVLYRPNTPVEGIEAKDGKAVGVRVNGAVIPADIVVSGADLAFTETQLLPRQYQTYPSSYWERKKAAPAALLLYLGVRGKLPELQHHNLFFVKDWQKNFGDIYTAKQWPQKASMYVSRTSASDTSVAPKGHENIFVLVPLPAGKELDAQTQQKLVDRYLAQLAQLSGIADLQDRIVSMKVRGPADFVNDFHAWQGSALGMSHTLRQSAFMRPNVKSKKVSNLYYVGGMTQPGIGVPMCLISAELVVKALTGDKSPGPIDTLPEAVV
jgi:phytoene desaturase